MRKISIPAFLIVAVLLWGCGDDNGTDGGNGNGPVETPRLVVDTLATAPTMTDANEAVWFTVDSVLVKIGGSDDYGVNNNLQEQDIVMRAIKHGDTLYVWVRWHDPTGADLWANRLRRLSGGIWEVGTLVGQDMFFIMFDGQDNGTEMADCASMCHSPIMKTTGGGKCDVWKWMSASTMPGFMSDDLFIDLNGTNEDNVINDYVWRANYDPGSRPEYNHVDSNEYSGVFLYLDEAVTYDPVNTGFWQVGDTIPGHVVDSTIYSSPDRNQYSRNNVRSVAYFDSTSASNLDWTWTVVFSRALNTAFVDDVSMAALDSIQVSVAATHNHTTDPLGIPEHSGSAPFWLILEP